MCIFAYGQTGSGKTFTIQGSPEKPGLTPKSINEMFDILGTMHDYEINLKCYMVEIYLSQLRDLLLKPGKKQGELEVKKYPAQQVYIQGVTEVPITTAKEALEIFDRGLSQRKTRATKMNDASSRSHLIFSIIIEVVNKNT